ncbi:MAG: serine/threonine-protein kinase, partial [Myxococcaceae bacterium]
ASRPPPPMDEPMSPQITAHRAEPTFAPPPPPAAQAAPAAPAPGTKGTDIDLRYVKFDPIGSGPLGTVFKGRHNALGLDICVKELKDIFGYFSFLQRGEVIKRLKKELCAQAQVRHPGIVAVLDQNTDVARPYFVMELLKSSLREKLDQGGGKGIAIPLAIRYFLQLSYALRASHAQGLTHHNIKPENVLFDSYGNAKIGDFGLARVIEVDASKGMPQVFVGTGGMGYMAPELISRNKEATPSADVYGLGILLYEMTTGQIPGRRSPLPSEVNSEVPSKLDPIFDKMTQDRKEARYADFDAMLEDFYGAFSDGEYLARGDLLMWSEAPKG